MSQPRLDSGANIQENANTLKLPRCIKNMSIYPLFAVFPHAKLTSRLTSLVLSLSLTFALPASLAETSDSASKMQDAAKRLLSSLDASDRALAHREFQDKERMKWNFWPGRYQGVRFDEISGVRLQNAKLLLASGLSELGYSKLQVIQALEKFNPYDSPYYSILVFGEPSATEPWAWRMQGHHVSLNFTLVNGQVVANTPAFFGAQPLSHPTVKEGSKPLRDEEEKARYLFNSLNKKQQSQASISRPLTLYLPHRSKKARQHNRKGIAWSGLTAVQGEALLELIRVYTDNMPQDIAKQRWDEIKQESVDKLYFGYDGAGKSGEEHYYRIQGPTFIIEYDCVDDGEHIHVVWREFAGDFGEDVLKKHYQQHPH